MTKVLVCLASLLLLACQSQYFPKNMPKSVQGTLDLRSIDFSQDQLIELKGDWLCQGLNEIDECLQPGSMRSMPFSRWRDYPMVQAGKSLHARLAVDLLLPEDQKLPLSLNIRDVFGAYQVKLIDPQDGSLLFLEQHGQISSTQALSVPNGEETWIPVPFKSRVRLEIEISGGSGSFGFFRPPILGRAQIINEQREKTLLQMAAIIGGFALLGLYSLVLFIQRTQDKGHLIIGILSLDLALRQMSSEHLIQMVLGTSKLAFYLQSDMLIISYLGSLFLFSTYLFHRAGRLKQWRMGILIGLLLLILTEAMIFTSQMGNFKVFLGFAPLVIAYYAGLLLLAFVVIFRVKAQGSDLHLVRLSLVLPVFGIAFDAGVAQMNIDAPYIAHYTLLVFILAQSVLVGRAFAQSFNENERLLVEVREKENSRTVFFHNTSHELRTPLNGIIGFLELLASGRYGAMSEESISQLQKCARLALSLKNQVNTILDLAKSRKGTLELSNSQFRMADLVNEAQDLAEGLLLKYKNSEFSLQIDPGLQSRSWIGDYGKMATILRNLLGNAFKFADPDRLNTVKLQFALQGNRLSLEVADRGIGIPADQQATVFEEFKQVEGDARRAYEGTGLGLSMVRDLTRLMNGTVELTSVVGEGSCFRVTLVEQSQVHMTSTPELMEKPGRLSSRKNLTRKPWTSPELDASKGRIMVVDDNEINCEVLQDLLENEGFEVVVAYGGAEALRKARVLPPDLMLLDMMMPQMSGEDVLHEMKNDPALEDVPVILVTARASEDDRIFGLSLGADDYLAKPIHHEELNFRVRNLLRRIETIHKTDAMEERERMAQLGEMMRELSHELKNLFQMGKLDPETIRESSQKTLQLLPLESAVWNRAWEQMSEGRQADEPEFSQLLFQNDSESNNNSLRSLRFILGTLLLADEEKQKLWLELRSLSPEHQATCEQVLTLIRSYQLLEQQAGHAAQLVVSVLDYSRSSQNLESCQLDEVWSTLQKLVQPRLKKHRILIKNQWGSMTLPISTAHMMQILLNLIGNAIDAMQPLKPDRRWIQFTASEEQGQMQVSISNAGSPIPRDMQEHLFERDVSTKGGSGSGLGLYISRKLVQRSAGHIRYDGSKTHPSFVLSWKKKEAGHGIPKVS